RTQFPLFAGLSFANLRVDWGLVTAVDTPAEIVEALAPLIDARRKELKERARLFSGQDGLQAEESAQEFLARHGSAMQAKPGLDPVPRYLLLVGHPEEIPFRIQTDLSAGRYVGRIAFDR